LPKSRLKTVSAGVSGLRTITQVAVLAPEPSPAVTVSVVRCPAGASAMVIVALPVPEAGENFSAELGHAAFHEAFVVTVTTFDAGEAGS